MLCKFFAEYLKRNKVMILFSRKVLRFAHFFKTNLISFFFPPKNLLQPRFEINYIRAGTCKSWTWTLPLVGGMQAETPGLMKAWVVDTSNSPYQEYKSNLRVVQEIPSRRLGIYFHKHTQGNPKYFQEKLRAFSLLL